MPEIKCNREDCIRNIKGACKAKKITMFRRGCAQYRKGAWAKGRKGLLGFRSSD